MNIFQKIINIYKASKLKDGDVIILESKKAGSYIGIYRKMLKKDFISNGVRFCYYKPFNPNWMFALTTYMDQYDYFSNSSIMPGNAYKFKCRKANIFEYNILNKMMVSSGLWLDQVSKKVVKILSPKATEHIYKDWIWWCRDKDEARHGTAQIRIIYMAEFMKYKMPFFSNAKFDYVLDNDFNPYHVSIDINKQAYDTAEFSLPLFANVYTATIASRLLYDKPVDSSIWGDIAYCNSR